MSEQSPNETGHEECYNRVEAFIGDTDEDLERVIVPAEHWDYVKSKADVSDDSISKVTIDGVRITWKAVSQPTALVMIDV